MAKTNLEQYFDRVVLINLKRRPDRLARVRAALRDCEWPFKEPEIFVAVDGSAVPPNPQWKSGPGAWGCMLSHRQIFEQAFKDGINSILILEDDVCFADDFKTGIRKFLAAVPHDWDQLMIGGQHQNFLFGEPELVKPGVYRCKDCERTHCYAIRGGFMRKLYERWHGGGALAGNEHCDHIMGRDPEMQRAHKVYAPEFFLAGQERGRSDIFNLHLPRKFWNPPGPQMAVINLHAPAPVASALRRFGFYTGRDLNGRGAYDAELTQLFYDTEQDPAQRQIKLRDWIKVIQWELADDSGFVCTVWHPQATPALVKAASLWKVYEITAESVEDAVRQLPRKLRPSLIQPQ